MFKILYPKPSDPNHPCTKITHVLSSFDVAVCNLTHASFHVLTCFELLNDWYGVGLGTLTYIISFNRDPMSEGLSDLPCHDKD
ncbi:unnamed protein product [Malus baccata var. baccata]